MVSAGGSYSLRGRNLITGLLLAALTVSSLFSRLSPLFRVAVSTELGATIYTRQLECNPKRQVF